MIENENVISDQIFNYSDEFIQFRKDLFEILIQALAQLRPEGFFKSVYQEYILINFEVRDYYQEDEMLEIFERINTKEDFLSFHFPSLKIYFSFKIVCKRHLSIYRYDDCPHILYSTNFLNN